MALFLVIQPYSSDKYQKAAVIVAQVLGYAKKQLTFMQSFAMTMTASYMYSIKA